MATVTQAIIVPAFQDLGVVRPGASITTALSDAALIVLNQGIDGLSAEQAMANVLYHQSFTLTAGTSVYTVGTAGTLVSTARPVRITGWQSKSGDFKNGGQCVSFEKLHEQQKDNLGMRSVLAEMVAADFAYPAINLEVWPTPDASPGNLILDYYSPLAQFAAVGDTVTLPDGYVQLLRTQLAKDLYPQYARVGGNNKEDIFAAWQNAKSQIATKNSAILSLVQQAA